MDLNETIHAFEEKNKRLILLQKVCNTLRGSMEVEEIFKLIGEGLTKDLGYKYFIVALVDKKANTLVDRFVSQLPHIINKVEKLINQKLIGHKIPLDETHIPHLKQLQKGEAVIFYDFADLLGPLFGTFVGRTLQKLLGTNLAISQPLMAKDELIGNMLIFSSKKEISEEEKELISTLAATAAISINQTQTVTSLQKAYEEISRLNDLRTNLLARVSHEYRTPITIIQGYAEILLNYFPEDSEQREFSQSIMNECSHLIFLVNRMIDLTKIEQSRFKMNFTQVDIQAILKKAVLGKKVEFEKKKIELETKIHEVLPLVTADELKIKRVFLDILDNALKFTPKGGKVRVETKLHPDSIDVIISDTGIGIKKEHLERIFDEFYQADSSSTREFGGLGIGLSIVKHIMNMHKGKLWIKSEEGGGTEVVVRLMVME